MPKMILFGGEHDGLEIVTASAPPKVFYAVPYTEQSKIDVVKGRQAKAELRAKLATLAYEFQRTKSDPDHFRMYRNSKLDKVTQK